MKKPALCFFLLAVPASAQEMDGMAMHGALGGYAMNRESSGTSWQPDLGPSMGRG